MQRLVISHSSFKQKLEAIVDDCSISKAVKKKILDFVKKCLTIHVNLKRKNDGFFSEKKTILRLHEHISSIVREC